MQEVSLDFDTQNEVTIIIEIYEKINFLKILNIWGTRPRC